MTTAAREQIEQYFERILNEYGGGAGALLAVQLGTELATRWGDDEEWHEAPVSLKEALPPRGFELHIALVLNGVLPDG